MVDHVAVTDHERRIVLASRDRAAESGRAFLSVGKCIRPPSDSRTNEKLMG